MEENVEAITRVVDQVVIGCFYDGIFADRYKVWLMRISYLRMAPSDTKKGTCFCMVKCNAFKLVPGSSSDNLSH